MRVLKNSIRAGLSGFGLDFGPGSGLKIWSISGFGPGSGLRNEGRAFTSPARNPARPDVCPGLVQAAPNPSHIWGAMSLSELSAMLFPTRGPNTTQNPTPWGTLPSCRTLSPSSSVSHHSLIFLAGALYFITGWDSPHFRPGALFPSYHTSPRTTKEECPHQPLALRHDPLLPCSCRSATTIKAEEACAAHDDPKPRRQIRCLMRHCHVVTYSWMSCITTKQKYDGCCWGCN